MADFFESYASIRQHVLIRFGKWREIVAQELPTDRELYCNSTAMIHYAKGVAHAALGEVAAAEAEPVRFREAVKRVPKSRFLHNVPCVQLLEVAEEMLAGEVAYRRGEHDVAFTHLRSAIALEDALPYDEPWGGCSRSATRSVRFSWSRGESPRLRAFIGRISGSAAACHALRSIPTICGPCADCWTASTGAAKLRRPC